MQKREGMCIDGIQYGNARLLSSTVHSFPVYSRFQSPRLFIIRTVLYDNGIVITDIDTDIYDTNGFMYSETMFLIIIKQEFYTCMFLFALSLCVRSWDKILSC